MPRTSLWLIWTDGRLKLKNEHERESVREGERERERERERFRNWETNPVPETAPIIKLLQLLQRAGRVLTITYSYMLGGPPLGKSYSKMKLDPRDKRWRWLKVHCPLSVYTWESFPMWNSLCSCLYIIKENLSIIMPWHCTLYNHIVKRRCLCMI